VNGSKFLYGDFINAVVSFLLIAAAIYYFVVLPVNALVARLHNNKPTAAPDKKQCPECRSDIPVAARKCAYCTSVVA
jgi:large conductance mechanosensitive channel